MVLALVAASAWGARGASAGPCETACGHKPNVMQSCLHLCETGLVDESCLEAAETDRQAIACGRTPDARRALKKEADASKKEASRTKQAYQRIERNAATLRDTLGSDGSDVTNTDGALIGDPAEGSRGGLGSSGGSPLCWVPVAGSARFSITLDGRSRAACEVALSARGLHAGIAACADKARRTPIGRRAFAVDEAGGPRTTLRAAASTSLDVDTCLERALAPISVTHEQGRVVFEVDIRARSAVRR